MTLYKQLNEYDLQDMLIKCDRDNFSLTALRAYVEFIRELGESQEFDAITFDCSFCEYDLSQPEELEQFNQEYGYLVEGEEFTDEDSKQEAIRDAIGEKTLVILDTYNCFLFDYNF